MEVLSFVSSRNVKQAFRDDPALCDAIDQGHNFFPAFVETFHHRAIRQSDFIATVVCRDNDCLKPLGIAVEEINGEKLLGKLLDNTLSKPHPKSTVECALDQVVDLRFTDSFDCIGGYLFKEFYRRLRPEVRNPLWEQLDFLPIWYQEPKCDLQFCELLRDIANLRYDIVRCKLSAHPELASRLDFAPRPSHHPNELKVMLNLVTPMQYAAEFGDAAMIETLHKISAIDDQPGGNSPLCWSAIRGNYETTLAMLKLGFDPEVTDKHGSWPLYDAAMWGRGEIIELLLHQGVDLNRQGNSGETVVFDAKSTQVIKQLLIAGARTDLVDDEDRTCVDWHNEHGRRDIVDLLVEHGALPPHDPPGPNEEEVRQRGREVLQDLLANDKDFARNYVIPAAVNYGYILPAQHLSKS